MKIIYKIKSVFKMLKYFPKSISLIYKFDRRKFITVIFLSLFLGIIPSISLILSQEMINVITLGGALKQVFLFLFLYVLVSLSTQYLSCYKTYIDTYLQNNINFKLSCLVMEKSKNLTLANYEDSVIYDKLQRIQGEISFKPYQSLQLLLSIITTLATLFSAALILILWKPWSALFLLIIPLLSSLYYFKLGKYEFDYKLKRTEQGRKSWYISRLLTTDSTVKEIKLFSLADFLTDEYKKIKEKFICQDMNYMKKRTWFDVLYETILHICSCIVVIISVIDAYSGRILIGNVVTYIRSISLVETSCSSLLNNIYSLYNNSLYIKELFEFLELKEAKDETDIKNKRELKKIEEIELKNVSFIYRQGKKVLDNINLKMKKGEKIAIVGANGSGKTTLIKLLTHLYPLTEGHILINGIDSKDYSVPSIRKNISVLFQDFVKYEMNVRCNVGYGNIENISADKKVYETLERVGFKKEFPEGLETQLGLWFNNGIGLSGGQWQRLAIARTMFKECSAYILDEPSSALDPIAINEVLEKFFEYASDKLCIFITHKMSSIHYADRIIVMKNGKICGNGTHQELYESNDYYRELYDKEMK